MNGHRRQLAYMLLLAEERRRKTLYKAARCRAVSAAMATHPVISAIANIVYQFEMTITPQEAATIKRLLDS